MKPYKYPQNYVTTQRFLRRHVISRASGEIIRIPYEIICCKCGDCELYIKEMKNGVSADRMSCHKFSANQFRLHLSALAYILLQDAIDQIVRYAKNEVVTSAVKSTQLHKL